MSDLKNHVQFIADRLSNGFADEVNSDGDPMNAFDYLADALYIEYVVDGKCEYLGARVLVAFGGPNIWINTRTNTVEGAWRGDSANATFTDNIDLDDALSEMWECR